MEEAGPIVTIFRSRLSADGAPEYGELAERMLALARSMPGFVEFKTFRADDGERVSIIAFDSLASHQAWRDHPEHKAAQELGRSRFYDEYRIVVCQPIDERRFSRHPGAG